MKIKEITKILEMFAPLPLQESYDNSGLQVGLTEAETSRVLFCLDVTEDVIEYAHNQGCRLVIAHHPLLFRGVKRVGDSTIVERCLRLAIKYDITLYAAHTNLDNAEGGVSFQMAEKLGLTNLSFLRSEPKLANVNSGSGVVGEFSSPIPYQEFLQLLKNTFEIDAFQYAPATKSMIQRVALCGGSGDFLISDAIATEADAFITGEIGYHLYFGWERSIWLFALGHYHSEKYVPELMEKIVKEVYPELPTLLYPATTNPIKIYT